jgi:hypothetical protein
MFKYGRIIRCMNQYQRDHGPGTYEAAVKHAAATLEGVSEGTARRAWSEWRRSERQLKLTREHEERPRPPAASWDERSLLQHSAWATLKKTRNI